MKFRSLLALFACIVLAVSLSACSSSGGDEAEEPPTPEYSLHLNVACESNLLFAKYDISVAVDGGEIGSVAQGESFEKTITLKEGFHDLSFSKSGKPKPVSTVRIAMTEEKYYSCSLKAHNDSIDISDEVIETAAMQAMETFNSESANESESAEESSSSEEAVDSEAESSESSADNNEESSESSVESEGQKTAQALQTLAVAKLVQDSKYLEYSKEETDPVDLVECDNEDVEITSEGNIDLSKFGKQTVTYELSLDGQTETENVEFVVRDTKAPSIKLYDEKPSVKKGKSYDILDNIKSVKDTADGKLRRVSKAPKAKKGTKKKNGLDEIYEYGWYTVEGKVDTSTPGSYQIKVAASDTRGNARTKKFTVRVKKPQPQAANKYTYIVNVNTGVFHWPDCSSVSRMNESNKVELYDTREHVASMYRPCGNCNP